MKEIPDLVKYFPDAEAGKAPDRSFMWGVLGTLRRDACKALLEDARKNRGKAATEDKNQLIEIDPEFLSKILSAPTMSRDKR